VPLSIQKGTEDAKKNLFEVPLAGSTIIHPVLGEFGRRAVLLKPAAPGTGVIAGGARGSSSRRPGSTTCCASRSGSSNHINVARATIEALKAQKRPDVIAKLRARRPRRSRPRVCSAPTGRDRRPQRGPAGRGGLMAQLLVVQTKSGISTKPKHRGTLRALGLGRIGKRNVLPDRPEIRGMIAKVPHLIEVSETDEAATPTRRSTHGAGTTADLQDRSTS
jgi:ribosomal protein L30